MWPLVGKPDWRLEVRDGRLYENGKLLPRSTGPPKTYAERCGAACGKQLARIILDSLRR